MVVLGPFISQAQVPCALETLLEDYMEVVGDPSPRYGYLQEVPAPNLPNKIRSYIPQNDRQDLTNHYKLVWGDLRNYSGRQSVICEISPIFDCFGFFLLNVVSTHFAL